MKRIAVVAAAAALMTAMMAGAAAADPVNSKNSEVFSVACHNGETYEVVVAGGNPGHIIDSTSNLIPTSFTFTAIDPATGDEIFSETEPVGKGKKQGLQDDLVTCSTEPQTFTDPETGEDITFILTVDAFLTPRR